MPPKNRGGRKQQVKGSSGRLLSLKVNLSQHHDKNESSSEDRRLPEQRNELLAWADQYHAADERTIREQIKDAKHLNEPQSTTSLPVGQPSSTINNIRLTINEDTLPAVINNEPSTSHINRTTTTLTPQFKRFSTVHVSPPKNRTAMEFVHRHIFEPVPGCGVDLQTAANQAVREAQAGRMGTPVKKSTHKKRKDNHPSGNMNSEAVSSPKMKVLLLRGQSISFTAEDLTVPPILSYANNVPQLFVEWKESSFVLLKGMAVPICHWAELYRLNQPETWDILKKRYTEWKIIMEEYQSYSTAEDFWTQYTVKDLKTENLRRASYSELLKLIRQKRKDVDTVDAEKAQLEYTGDAWTGNFSYVKSGRSAVMKRPADIARLYRRLKQQPRSWDSAEDGGSQ